MKNYIFVHIFQPLEKIYLKNLEFRKKLYIYICTYCLYTQYNLKMINYIKISFFKRLKYGSF